MYKALYINDDDKRIIKANELTSEEYEKNYKGKLFCINENCKAEMIFIKKRNGTSYFRALNVNDHIEGCAYRSERITSHKHTVGEKGISTTLSKQHINRILDDTFMLAKGNKKRSYTVRMNKTLTSVTQDKFNTEVFSKAYNKSSKIKEKSNMKELPVYKKNISEFISGISEEIYCVYGYVKSINKVDDSIIITISDNESKLCLYAKSDIENSYKGCFNNFLMLKDNLDYYGYDNCICTCICSRHYSEGNVFGEIHDYFDVKFDNMSIKDKLCSLSRFQI